MPDYVPLFKPGTDVSLTVGATAVVGGNLCELSAANTVIPTTGAVNDWVGIATTDAAVGAPVGITSGGVQRLISSAAIAVGDILAPAAAGRVAPIGAGTFGQMVGVAMTAAAGAAVAVDVKMAR